jgi:two-component system chemotaxis response regulator CheB
MPPGRRIRILIVDDSAVMRSLLRTVVTADPLLEVAGTASDGASALQSLSTLRPDLMLLDVEMPVMDGLVTLKKMRSMGHRMPVIMCSSLTQRGARVTIEALAGGASDYVAKPSGQSGREAAIRALSQELLPKIHALTSVAATQPVAAPFSEAAPSVVQMPMPIRPQAATVTPAVVVLGVSTGGPAALDEVLPALPNYFPLPVLVVQHMPELFTKLLAERLNGRCKLTVREAAEGATVVPGTISIARGNWHMEVRASANTSAPPMLHLTQGPMENHCRPAVDVLFRSAASVYGGAVLAVVLTGMGSDGLAGCRLLRAQGATVLAQDQPTSAVWGMPGAVTNAGLAHRVLPLRAVAPEILRIVNRTSSEARELRESVV